MAEDIVVIGAGGFGRETLDVIEAINAACAEPVWNIVGVVDDGPAEIQVERLHARGIMLLGGVDALRPLIPQTRYVIAIGSPVVRARIAAELDDWGATAATLVHPSAVVGTQTVIAPGAIVCGGVQLSTNLRLGRHVHVNPGAIVGHDSRLDDFASVNPGAIVSGEVRVRTGTLVGAGATLLQGLTIGDWSVVGASSCVTKSVVPGSTVLGIPARNASIDGRLA